MRELALELCRYIDASPSPFHAVNASAELLGDAFTELHEGATFDVSLGGSYHVVRNQSSLIAVRVPKRIDASTRITVIGAHTDSPTFKLKPIACFEKEGYRQFGVEVYGGPLIASWTDRDLTVAGRLFFRADNDREPTPVLYRSERPLCRIPQLAIHLNREVNDKGLALDKQKHLAPIWALESDKPTDLLGLICQELGRDEADLLGHELFLADTLPSALIGAHDDFIAAPRLDNLANCFGAVTALRKAAVQDTNFAVIALFDNEEVGSRTNRGADSNFLPRILLRLCQRLGLTDGEFAQILDRSLFVSADVAHAVHPNYADLHEPRHFPKLNAGPVIKYNAQERYATTGLSASIIRGICQRLEIPHQQFVNRTDLACGSTIGPMTASKLGMPTVDLGSAILSMHSVREMAGTEDVTHLQALFDELLSA